MPLKVGHEGNTEPETFRLKLEDSVFKLVTAGLLIDLG